MHLQLTALITHRAISCVLTTIRPHRADQLCSLASCTARRSHRTVLGEMEWRVRSGRYAPHCAPECGCYLVNNCENCKRGGEVEVEGKVKVEGKVEVEVKIEVKVKLFNGVSRGV